MRKATLQDYKRRLLRVLVHIQEHLDDPLSLEELADIACFSPYHFHRIFKGMVGESLKEYVRRLRLERAAGRLKLGGAPITRIAFEAGYESHEAFTRSFKLAFGVSPSHFRASRKLAMAVAVPSGLHFSNGKSTANFRITRPGGCLMEVKIQSLQTMSVAFMRHVGPYSEVGATWDKLLGLLGKDGWLGGDTLFIGICHDDPEVTPADRIRYDACVSVDKTFQPIDEIGVQTIEGGEYAVTTHFGPYHQMGGTYTRLLGQWLPRSGRELRSCPCFEVYLNDPQSTDPDDLLTDIYAPVTRRTHYENSRQG